MRDKLFKYFDCLREKGFRLTPARKIMLEIFLSEKNKLLTALEIYDRVRQRKAGINFSTVYRNLEILANAGFVERFVFETGAKYKLIENNVHSHNLICTACHKTEPLPFCPIRELEDEVRKRSGFQPTDHRIEIFGICKNCRNDQP